MDRCRRNGLGVVGMGVDGGVNWCLGCVCGLWWVG